MGARRAELERIERAEASAEARLARLRAEARALAPVTTPRRELAAIDEVLGERAKLA